MNSNHSSNESEQRTRTVKLLNDRQCRGSRGEDPTRAIRKRRPDVQADNEGSNNPGLALTHALANAHDVLNRHIHKGYIYACM